DVLLDRRVARPVLSPAVAGPTVGSRAGTLGAAQADADVVAPAQTRGQPKGLLLVAAVAVEEDQQRIGVMRLVAGRQEGADRPTVEGLHLGGVEALDQGRRVPGKMSMRHE